MAGRREIRLLGNAPAAGGGRWVEVDPERLAGWLDRFAQRHGGIQHTTVTVHGLLVTAADGVHADCHILLGWRPEKVGDVRDGLAVDDLVATALVDRRIGVLLARRGGFAVGIAEGTRITASKVDSTYVQSRTAAGGWSQQRFARRRQNQARQAAQAAAEVAVRLLLPHIERLEAVVAGGDRATIDAIMADRRLEPLLAKRAPRLLDVPDPRRHVLEAAPRLARAVRIHVSA